jgi:methionyl-tRNA synthetase
MRKKSKTFYITTAIDYPNNRPHIGTAYEKIGADVIARYYRLAGYETFFLMGTDEHSQNVEKAAREQEISPPEFLEKLVPEFEEAWAKLDISYDDFIRTTEERHRITVQALVQRCYDKGDIYKGEYSGYYCPSCEAFYDEEELVDRDGDKCCPTHPIPLEHIIEENYFFALSRYSGQLKAHIEKNPGFIQPVSRRNEVLGLIKSGLKDFSVSRAKKKWGIPCPFDKEQVIYVWFDALTNYISALAPVDAVAAPFDGGTERYTTYWPADIHVIGKDITRFHCLYWPAMLMSAGLPLPDQVWGHGWVHAVTLDENGEPRKLKMSKTLLSTRPELAALFDPIVAAERHGTDALRYFLLREIQWDRDGNFMLEKFDERYNSDLANDLGNLLNRVLSMIGRYCGGTVPEPRKEGPEDSRLREAAESAVKDVCGLVEASQLSQALVRLWELIGAGNQYVEKMAPWALYKDPDKKDQLETVLYNLAEVLRIVGILVSPFMPNTGEKVWQQLGLGDKFQGAGIDAIKKWGGLRPGTTVSKPVPIFPKEAQGKE